MSIHLDLSDTLVKDKLANLPEKMLEWALEVLMAKAHLMVGYAQLTVNVDTGSLRDSIRVERGGEGLHWRQVKVRAGGYITNPKTGKLVNYAWIQEMRTRFLSSAVAEVTPTIAAMIEARVVQKVNE